MNWRTILLAALSLYTALLIQRSALPRLGLPGAEPVPLLVLVAAFALVRGPFVGCLVGFFAGLLADLSPPATSGVGREALVLCFIGYVCGLVAGEVDRSVLAPLAVVAAASVALVVGNAIVGALFGAARPTMSALARQVPAVAFYDVLLAPFVIPVIAVLVRRLDPEPRR